MRARAVTFRAVTFRAVTFRAVTFRAVADGLSVIATEGWSGRAAERFRERFEVEPRRWQEAGDGFGGRRRRWRFTRGR